MYARQTRFDGSPDVILHVVDEDAFPGSASGQARRGPIDGRVGLEQLKLIGEDEAVEEGDRGKATADEAETLGVRVREQKEPVPAALALPGPR